MSVYAVRPRTPGTNVARTLAEEREARFDVDIRPVVSQARRDETSDSVSQGQIYQDYGQVYSNDGGSDNGSFGESYEHDLRHKYYADLLRLKAANAHNLEKLDSLYHQGVNKSAYPTYDYSRDDRDLTHVTLSHATDSMPERLGIHSNVRVAWEGDDNITFSRAERAVHNFDDAGGVDYNHARYERETHHGHNERDIEDLWASFDLSEAAKPPPKRKPRSPPPKRHVTVPKPFKFTERRKKTRSERVMEVLAMAAAAVLTCL